MNSTVVTNCAICGSPDLTPVLNVGYLPPVNTMQKIGERLVEQPFFPAELLRCWQCSLVQIGCVVDSSILFPPSYTYRSGTTQALRDNFADLVREVGELGYAKPGDRVIDIGSNDGTLLNEFKQVGFAVLGIEPTDAADVAKVRGIPTIKARLGREWIWTAGEKGRVVTACNVFAHISDIHGIVGAVLGMLTPDGVFVVEAQYLPRLEYDTVYHEHLYYYSLTSLYRLFDQHGMEILHAKSIPTHGGSVRVYAARKGTQPIRSFCSDWSFEVGGIAKKAMRQKLELLALLAEIKRGGQPIYGIGCPSRAVTLIHYCGLDGILDCVCETAASPKVDHYVPGTTIPIVDEAKLYADQPRYALLLSWHLADSLIPKIRANGFQGQFILPLPTPRIA